MRRLVVLAVLAAIAAVAAPLVLATTTASDPNDTAGKLDFKSAKAARDGQLLHFTITTYDGWASSMLQGKNGSAGPMAGRNAMTVLYDVNKDGRADYQGKLLYFQKHLRLWISGKRSNFEPLPVKRPNSKTASFTHPVDVFYRTPGTKTLRLAVTSMDRDSVGCGLPVLGGCKDRIPNSGWIPVVFHVT